MLLQSIWFFLWGLLWAVFFITDGFDMGIGTLLPFLGKSEEDKRTMISAMGHTYFWFQLQQLRELALEFGIPENNATESIKEMLLGTIETLFNSGLSYDQVIDLIPVKPIAESEEPIKEIFNKNLTAVYNKIKSS